MFRKRRQLLLVKPLMEGYVACQVGTSSGANLQKKMTAVTPMIIINSSDWEDGWFVVAGVEKARISKSTQSGS